jgi:DNA-binding transcriptional ArsR family regulator
MNIASTDQRDLSADHAPSDSSLRVERDLDVAAMKAMAHPLRMQMFDILSQYGPQTASSLADLTGESTGATSYHLRTLARHGLIREVEDRGTARERWWERVPGSVNFVPPEALETPAGKEAARVVMGEFLRRRAAQTERFIANAISETDAWQDGSVLSTSNMRLTPEQSKDMIEQVTAIVNEFKQQYRDQQGPGVRPTTVNFDAFPLPENAGE